MDNVIKKIVKNYLNYHPKNTKILHFYAHSFSLSFFLHAKHTLNYYFQVYLSIINVRFGIVK